MQDNSAQCSPLNDRATHISLYEHSIVDRHVVQARDPGFQRSGEVPRGHPGEGRLTLQTDRIPSYIVGTEPSSDNAHTHDVDSRLAKPQCNMGINATYGHHNSLPPN